MANIRRFQKGLTLIEVLVSMLVFLVVLLAVYQLFDTSHATYVRGTRKQDVQQQARLAMDEMVRGLRMAGYIPENFNGSPPIVNSLRIHMGTPNFLAAFGGLDGNTAQSAVFTFCRSGNTLVAKRATDTAAAATYACSGDVIADNVTLLQFTYFNDLGAQVAAGGSLDNQAPGSLATGLALPQGDPARAQRESVRTIVITLRITEPLPPQPADQEYTLTSTVRLRNLNNT
jgi:prepilin-type N-terminal cleavage/methylation domain-containing protein